MEDTSSQPSCISRPASTSSAGESSWAMHFAWFLQASSGHGDQEMNRQGGVYDSSFFSSFDSLGGGDDDSITSDMVCDADEDDDSLQDTACSCVNRPEVTRMNGMCMQSMVAMDAKETSNPQLAKYLVDASSRRQPTGAVQEVISGGNNDENQLHGGNDLRKRGLCLVPLSMLIDYLG